MNTRITLCAAACALLLGPAVAHAASARMPHSPAQTIAADTGACPAPVPEVIKEGQKIFTGPGNCSTCHGANAKGTPLAPDLTDAKWLNIDGSYEAIVALIHRGVPKPKEHPAPMPVTGGAKLTDAQVCAVGAYVFSLSHKAATAVEK